MIIYINNNHLTKRFLRERCSTLSAAFNNYKLIYVFSVDDEAHKGLLKIGEATFVTDQNPINIEPNSDILNEAAHKRIDAYTKTVGTSYTLLYTEVAIREVEYDDGAKVLLSFGDRAVHDVYRNSGIRNIQPNGVNNNEWFELDLNTAIAGIKAAKNNEATLNLSGTNYNKYISVNNCVKSMSRIETAYALLESGQIGEAMSCFKKILIKDPCCSRAYWGRLMANLFLLTEDELCKYDHPIDELSDYKCAIKFGTEEEQIKYKEVADIIRARYEENEKTKRIAAEKKAQEEREFSEKISVLNANRHSSKEPNLIEVTQPVVVADQESESKPQQSISTNFQTTKSKNLVDDKSDNTKLNEKIKLSAKSLQTNKGKSETKHNKETVSVSVKAVKSKVALKATLSAKNLMSQKIEPSTSQAFENAFNESLTHQMPENVSESTNVAEEDLKDSTKTKSSSETVSWPNTSNLPQNGKAIAQNISESITEPPTTQVPDNTQNSAKMQKVNKRKSKSHNTSVLSASKTNNKKQKRKNTPVRIKIGVCLLVHVIAFNAFAYVGDSTIASLIDMIVWIISGIALIACLITVAIEKYHNIKHLTLCEQANALFPKIFLKDFFKKFLGPRN